MAPGLKDILNIYRNNSLFTRLHIWVRFKTCPFLLIEKFVPREGLIIDYGCGYGIFSHILSLLSSVRKVYGFDISKIKIKEAKKTAGIHSRLQFLDSKAEVDNIVTAADCITLLDVICYFSNRDREEMFRSFYKNMKEEAILVIKDIQKKLSIKYSWLYLQELIAVKLLKITEARLLNFFNADYFSGLLKDIGFEVQIVDISKNYLYPHILFICRKSDYKDGFK